MSGSNKLIFFFFNTSKQINNLVSVYAHQENDTDIEKGCSNQESVWV